MVPAGASESYELKVDATSVPIGKHSDFSIRRQCEPLGMNRSGSYYEPVGESEENLRFMRMIDEVHAGAVLRKPKNGEVAGGRGLSSESQTDLAIDGGDGNRGRLSKAEAEPAGRRAQDLSVPVEGRHGR